MISEFRHDSLDGTLPVPLSLPSLDTEGQQRRHLLALPALASPDRPMSLRDVLARLLPDALDGYGDPERWADAFMRDPALAAAERVLAAADQWDQTDSIRDRKRLSEAVGDFRAYRSAVDASQPVEP